MSPEAQRIAIAEACGWDMNPKEAAEWKSQQERHPWCKSPSGELVIICGSDFPDYLNDLNAMHEAEKTLVDHTGYCMELQHATGGLPLRFNLTHASASQRAEAFLKTIGKWQSEAKSK